MTIVQWNPLFSCQTDPQQNNIPSSACLNEQGRSDHPNPKGHVDIHHKLTILTAAGNTCDEWMLMVFLQDKGWGDVKQVAALTDHVPWEGRTAGFRSYAPTHQPAFLIDFSQFLVTVSCTLQWWMVVLRIRSKR